MDLRGISFVTDGHRGLLFSMRKVFPDSQHLRCLMHVLGSYKKTYCRRMLFNRVAYARSREEYELAMLELGEIAGSKFIATLRSIGQSTFHSML